jgi:FkbM family methyltransferase
MGILSSGVELAGPTAHFLTRNDDVFLLTGPEVTALNLDLQRVTVDPDSYPAFVELEWSGGDGNTRPSAEVSFCPISAARRARGDVLDIVLTLRQSQLARENSVLFVRLPFLPTALQDLRFGIVAAMSLKCSRSSVLEALAVGVADGGGFLFAGHMPIGPVSHLSVASRLMAQPQAPCVQLQAVMRPFEGELTLRIARVFVGQEYQPYVFNPQYERIAAISGLPDLGRVREAQTEFLRQAEEAMGLHDYRGGQCFLKPSFVHRGPDPCFPMLLGTPNSLAWYGQTPSHNAGFYVHEGYVRAGDTVLDCGAHAGEISMIFAKAAGPGGKVIAFDPFPQNYLQIEAQAILNGTSSILSTRTGVGVRRETMMTELELQMTTGAASAAATQSSVFPLEIEALDGYLDAKPALLKLDVEGAEVGALLGATRLLAECRPRIFIEVHPQFIVQFGHTPADLFAAIPVELYHVQYAVAGAPPGWHDYGPEAAPLFDGKVGGLVRCFPR